MFAVVLESSKLAIQYCVGQRPSKQSKPLSQRASGSEFGNESAAAMLRRFMAPDVWNGRPSDRKLNSKSRQACAAYNHFQGRGLENAHAEGRDPSLAHDEQ